MVLRSLKKRQLNCFNQHCVAWRVASRRGILFLFLNQKNTLLIENKQVNENEGRMRENRVKCMNE